MRRILPLFACLALLFSLCACGKSENTGNNKLLRYVEECWEDAGSGDAPEEVYIIRYTSRRNLSGEVLDTDMYEKLPEQGYAILFHTHVAGDPFSASYACFLDKDGDLVFSFDYKESHDLYEKYYSQFSIYNTVAGEKAIMYLSNCNYIAHMINHANDHCEKLKSTISKNTWYSLSDAQIRRIS